MRRTIAVDFDGTLCENQFPYIGNPQLDVIRQVKQEQANGSAIILWTCREGELLDNAITWCHHHGLEFDAVNDSTQEWKEMFGDTPRKIGATEYWDDRAYNPIQNKKEK